MAVIGIDLGATKLAAGIFSNRGLLSPKAVVPLDGRKGPAVGKLIRDEVHRLLAAATARGLKTVAVGISVPGISHSRTGCVWAPNIPGWKNYPLRREIESAVRHSGARVFIDSDRACYILGETWRGVAKGCRNAIFLAVGTGIGAGIMIDGKILRGANDIAGAIGWMSLHRPFQSEYSSCGCFEYHGSGEGIVKIAKAMMAADRAYNGPLSTEPSLTTARVFAAYQRGDPLARKVLGQAVGFWGAAVANLVSLFNPEKIIFGGGVFGPAAQFLDDIYAEAKKWAQPVSIKNVKLVKSKLGGDAGLYGAGYLALRGVS